MVSSTRKKPSRTEVTNETILSQEGPTPGFWRMVKVIFGSPLFILRLARRHWNERRNRPWPWQYLFGFDIFISYARTDGLLYARRLSELLRTRGKKRLNCFLDEVDFAAGSDLRAATVRNLHLSSTLLLVITPSAIGSKYVETEIVTFRRFKKRSSP